MIDDGRMILIVLGPNANFLPADCLRRRSMRQGVPRVAAGAADAGGAGPQFT